MIYKKTGELNLTTELVNYTSSISGRRPFIIVPSQTAEAKRISHLHEKTRYQPTITIIHHQYAFKNEK